VAQGVGNEDAILIGREPFFPPVHGERMDEWIDRWIDATTDGNLLLAATRFFPLVNVIGWQQQRLVWSDVC